MDGRTTPRLRVFLADDHPLVLRGMKMLIGNDAGLELVGDASDGPSALQRAIELKPDVAVLDLWMPGLRGLDVARQFLSICPTSRVLVLTVHEDAAYLRKVLQCGVTGYILKRSATDELARGIHAVAAGGLYLDPHFLADRTDGELILRQSARRVGLNLFIETVDNLKRNSIH
ncbi:response regulator receiver domain protein [Rhodopseudomonas palustris HaA2]|uniref:Response regulator receiver domain protein n=1 Tax=Rhodopseudomonas palustris (strain HaA2) TaxID=316058 RepID=Q2IRN5_RHOP2|nr:response regulator receiver domain protein [Rhodopseudomonas palustris HaA2]